MEAGKAGVCDRRKHARGVLACPPAEEPHKRACVICVDGGGSTAVVGAHTLAPARCRRDVPRYCEGDQPDVCDVPICDDCDYDSFRAKNPPERMSRIGCCVFCASTCGGRGGGGVFCASTRCGCVLFLIARPAPAVHLPTQEFPQLVMQSLSP